MAVDRCFKSDDGNHVYSVTDLVKDGFIIFVCAYCSKTRIFDDVKKEWK